MASEGRERLHWSMARMDWDGSRFVLEIPNAFHLWPARWLNENLDAKLGDLAVGSRVSPAKMVESGIDEWGLIEIYLAEPFPQVATLRKRVNLAVDIAYQTANTAVSIANGYLDDLKAVTDS